MKAFVFLSMIHSRLISETCCLEPERESTPAKCVLCMWESRVPPLVPDGMRTVRSHPRNTEICAESE